MQRPVATSISAKQRNALGRGNSSAGRASDCKARRNADTGSSPWGGKGPFHQSRLSAQTLLRCPYSPCDQVHASWSKRTLKTPNTGGLTIVWTHGKCCTLRQEWVYSAALVVAAPYPGKATWISRRGRQSTKRIRGGGGGRGGRGVGLPQHTKDDKAQLPQRALETAPTATRLHCWPHLRHTQFMLPPHWAGARHPHSTHAQIPCSTLHSTDELRSRLIQLVHSHR